MFARFRGKLSPEAMGALRESLGYTEAGLSGSVLRVPLTCARRPRALGRVFHDAGDRGHLDGARVGRCGSRGSRC